MAHSSINRKLALKVLDWCIENLGISSYHPTTPRLILSSKTNINLYGRFFSGTNTIIIYKHKHKTLKCFVGTIIHEYIHYLQCLDDYDELDPNNIHEQEAIKSELKYTAKCIAHIK